ncbi:MAG: anthranilate synthase component I [Planctomycetota bacterium]|nr:anthranilate synthase component I [Planctomycetota bacterium]
MSRFLPDFETFSRLASQGSLVPIYRQLVADTLTPLSAYSKLQWGESSFLFESVVGGEQIGRFSFLGADPFLQIEAFGNTVVVTRDGVPQTHTSDDPLRDLEELVAKYRAPHVPGLPRFCGGAVGYFSYDVVRYTERLPNAPSDDRQLPDLSFALYDRMVIFDQIRKTILVVAHAQTQGGDLRALYDAACERIDETCRRLPRGAVNLPLTAIDLSGDPHLEWKSNFTREGFEDAVRKCQEYIRAGDIFQVVISQRLQIETSTRPIDIYRALRIVNPSPFMFLLRTPGVNLVGASPEIMVRVEEGEVTIRPLAGTRPRGKNDEEDARLERELLADPKERAEHVMLVDLARNDVGRVAQYGSVELSDVMKVERYSHVMHITSNVIGQLQPGKTALDALRAGLPAGTVSGAPKVRAMQIIDEIEPHRRGPYAGAVGYMDFTGNMDTCIALRTLVMIGQTAYVQAGAGIVADSVPSEEYQETLNKAKGLMKAIEIAQRQL